MWYFSSKENKMPPIEDFLKPQTGSTLDGIEAMKKLENESEDFVYVSPPPKAIHKGVFISNTEFCHGCVGKGWVEVCEKPFKCPVCEGSGIKPQDSYYHPPIVVQGPPLVGHGYGDFPKSDVKFPEYKTDFKENENE